jgi:hypothetical protein
VRQRIRASSGVTRLQSLLQGYLDRCEDPGCSLCRSARATLAEIRQARGGTVTYEPGDPIIGFRHGLIISITLWLVAWLVWHWWRAS